MGAICSSESQVLIETPLGLKLVDTEARSSIPNGAKPVEHAKLKPEGMFRKYIEFLETESKGVVEYGFDRQQSGWTGGISTYIQSWYRCSNSDIPKSLRVMKPTKEGWEWKEEWHMSKWVMYNDPYAHTKHRFRMWRRMQEQSGEWSEEDNIRLAEEEKAKKEEELKKKKEEDEKKQAAADAEERAKEKHLKAQQAAKEAAKAAAEAKVAGT